jgi:hypothetical protein
VKEASQELMHSRFSETSVLGIVWLIFLLKVEQHPLKEDLNEKIDMFITTFYKPIWR